LSGFEHKIKVVVSIKGINLPSTYSVGACIVEQDFIREKDSPFFGTINIALPNAFNLNSVPPGYYPGFSQNVYNAKMQIWDRGSGGLVFSLIPLLW
jgi:hypothetical protein